MYTLQRITLGVGTALLLKVKWILITKAWWHQWTSITYTRMQIKATCLDSALRRRQCSNSVAEVQIVLFYQLPALNGVSGNFYVVTDSVSDLWNCVAAQLIKHTLWTSGKVLCQRPFSGQLCTFRFCRTLYRVLSDHEVVIPLASSTAYAWYVVFSKQGRQRSAVLRVKKLPRILSCSNRCLRK